MVLDGAMGTSIHAHKLDLQRDWLGKENCSEILVLTRPDIIEGIHQSFLEVGCDAVETNTFGANRIVLAEFDLADRAYELNLAAAQLARRSCERFESAQRPRYVVGSIGPGTKLLSLGQVDWDTMLQSYLEQCRGLIAGGVDALLIETSQDLLQVKCALSAASDAMAEARVQLPLIVQVSMDTSNRMLLGSDMSAVVATLLPFGQIDCLGLNCATGPAEMGEHVQYLSHHWPRWISVQPNAGIPLTVDGQATFPLTPQDFAAAMMRFVRDYGVNLVGGCCGTTPAHLKMLIDALGHRAPVSRTVEVIGQISSLYSAEDIRQESSYLSIAERTNTNGSRQFRRLLEAGDWDGLVSVARDEVRDGAQLLDLCVDFVGRDGVADMSQAVSRLVRQVQAPLMLDSTSAQVMEAGLKRCGGRCVLNSMNLEDGEERVAQICHLARRYGAAVVAGTIDEDKQQAMARTAQRKLAIARRLFDLAVGKYGLQPQDLFFDPLVLPVSTGIEQDRRNALETIEGIRLISQEFAQCHTVIGLSNVSFGLKPAARVVLNSAFLHECREAGLTAAIVHPSKLLPQNRIDPRQWAAALDLLYDRRREGLDPLTHFIGLFADAAERAPATASDPAPLNIEDRLKRHIIDGEMRDLPAHLDEALRQHDALHIINNILLEGMKVVGELFGSGQMQLPFVLQSAQTMKAAVAHLEPHMPKAHSATRGTIVLATVKGDVHDIGKNLVDIILSNNGYRVVNLGIKQPLNEILRAAHDYKADAIGMSGLLVKSVAVMRENLEELNAHQVTLPVLLGGAALTRDYAEDDLASLYRGPLLYCMDAFAGLRAMDHIAGGKAQTLVDQQRQRSQRRRRLRESAVRPVSSDAAHVQPIVTDNPIPKPPFWGHRLVRDIPVRHILPFINELALFRGQWGFKQGALSADQFHRLTEDKARPIFEDLKRRALDEGFLQPAVAYGYFPVQSAGQELIVYQPPAHEGPVTGPLPERLRFIFPRQTGRRRLCITDFFRPVESGTYDVLGLQLVTMGSRCTELAEQLRRDGRYQQYLYLHGFCVEAAEALAEFWHKRMRQELGFSSEDAPDVRQLFAQQYRGSRYSFGYPACPDIEQRAHIMDLLAAADLGVSLSETFMLVPEQSTDALVAHHPQAKYFDV